MKLIHQNPFRILGLPVTATTREIENRTSELNMYLEMGKSVTYDTDFPFLSPVERSAEMVSQASNQMENDKDRFFNSLFWFWNSNTTDELALDVLKEGNVDVAVRLLEEQVANGDKLCKLYSSAKNLAIIYMALGCNGNSLDHDNFSKGLYWTGKTMSDDFLSIYASHYPNKYFTYRRDDIENAFVNEVIKTVSPLLNAHGGVSLSRFIQGFSSFPDETKRRIANRLVSKHFQTIEDAIALSEKERKANPGNAHLAATKLIKSTKQALAAIINTLDEYSAQNISDKISLELYNCGVNYYNYHIRNDTGTDPGDESLNIIKFAKKIAKSFSTKKLIDDNLPIIESWVENKQKREREKIIKPNIDYIINKIDNIPDPEHTPLNATLAHAKKLISDCKPVLQKIKSILGANDEYYIELSSAVVNSAMDLCIHYANKTKNSASVVYLFNLMSDLAKDSDTDDRYERNKTILTRNAELEEYLDPIINALEKLPEIDEISYNENGRLIDLANNLIDSTSEHLKSLKVIDRNKYLSFSSAVASAALNLCIEYANRTGSVVKPLNLMKKIELFDMEHHLKERLIKNREILRSNRNKKVAENINPYCYIATMVYGDANAPQVVVLRRFRDGSLNNKIAGKILINIYYKFSPLFVKYFGKYKTVHVFSKIILDSIVRRVS